MPQHPLHQVAYGTANRPLDPNSGKQKSQTRAENDKQKTHRSPADSPQPKDEKPHTAS
jgi:hypothetical protein